MASASLVASTAPRVSRAPINLEYTKSCKYTYLSNCNFEKYIFLDSFLSHFDVRNFPCENCGKEFKRKDKVCTVSVDVQDWAKEWSLGCVNSPPAARGSKEAGLTQPRDHFLPSFVFFNPSSLAPIVNFSFENTVYGCTPATLAETKVPKYQTWAGTETDASELQKCAQRKKYWRRKS